MQKSSFFHTQTRTGTWMAVQLLRLSCREDVADTEPGDIDEWARFLEDDGEEAGVRDDEEAWPPHDSEDEWTARLRQENDPDYDEWNWDRLVACALAWKGSKLQVVNLWHCQIGVSVTSTSVQLWLWVRWRGAAPWRRDRG